MGSAAADRDPRRSAGLRDDIVAALREGSLAPRHHRPRAARGRPGRRRPGRPRADLGRRPQGADGGRRGRRRPARARASCWPSSRPTPRSSTWPSCPADAPPPQEEINRVIVEAALAGKPGRALQGRRQLRLRPRLRGGARLPGGRRPGHGDPGDQQPARGARRWPGSRSPTAGVTHELTDRLGPPAAGPSRLARAVGRSGRAPRHPRADDGRRERPADRRGAGPRWPGRPATPVAIVCDGTMPTERTVLTTLG